MPVSRPASQYLPSVEEYLQQEAGSRLRHEYLAGEVFAMTGASPRHNRIAGRLYVAFANHLGSGPCQPYMSDVKVRFKINSDEYLYYPDVMVACDREGEREHYLRNPKLIVEILSPSTEEIDRREKAIHYRSILSLEEYALVAQDDREVTLQRRSDHWKSTVYTAPEHVVEFRSIGLSLPIAKIYEGV